MKKMMNASTSWCMQRRKIAGELQIHNHHRHHLSLLLGTILGQSPLEQQMKGVLTRLNIEQLMGKFETRNANCPWLTVKLVELLWLIQLAWTEVFCSLYLVIICLCLVKLTLPLLSTSEFLDDPNVNMSWLHVRRGGLCSRLALNHEDNKAIIWTPTMDRHPLQICPHLTCCCNHRRSNSHCNHHSLATRSLLLNISEL